MQGSVVQALMQQAGADAQAPQAQMTGRESWALADTIQEQSQFVASGKQRDALADLFRRIETRNAQPLGLAAMKPWQRAMYLMGRALGGDQSGADLAMYNQNLFSQRQAANMADLIRNAPQLGLAPRISTESNGMRIDLQVPTGQQSGGLPLQAQVMLGQAMGLNIDRLTYDSNGNPRVSFRAEKDQARTIWEMLADEGEQEKVRRGVAVAKELGLTSMSEGAFSLQSQASSSRGSQVPLVAFYKRNNRYYQAPVTQTGTGAMQIDSSDEVELQVPDMGGGFADRGRRGGSVIDSYGRAEEIQYLPANIDLEYLDAGTVLVARPGQENYEPFKLGEDFTLSPIQ